MSDNENTSASGSGWDDAVEAAWKEFPVGDQTDDSVRVAMTGGAYADVTAHAKDSLDQEVCGVVVGQLCKDDDGVWVRVEAAIRGTSAKQGGTHVTYTQETWDKIYEVKDRDYPKLSIVGWYHTHPGFGVEFSDMDLFIQQNFFSGPSQFALVIDPLGGEEAICVNDDGSVAHLRGFWVDGKRRTCKLPAALVEAEEQASESEGSVSRDLERKINNIEQRLSQLIQVSDEERHRNSRFLTIIGMLVGIAAVMGICVLIFDRATALPEPPKRRQYAEVPVEIDDEKVLLGISIDKWEIPPKLDAALTKVQEERLRKLQQQIVATQQENVYLRSQLKQLIAQIQSDDPEAASPDDEETPGRPWWNWALYALAAIAAVLLIASFAFSGKDSKDDGSDSSSEPSRSKKK